MASAMEIVRRQFPQVSRIVDSRKPIKISVTGRDVAASKKKSHNACAMAVACKREFKLDGIIVSVNRGYLIKGNRAVRFQIPESVSREIISFDRGAEFSVGEYKLDAIPKSARIGTKPRIRSERVRPHKMQRIHRTENIRAMLGAKE